MALPVGYSIYTFDKTSITVIVTDFLLMFKDSPDEIEHNGKIYYRQPLEALPASLSDKACSMRKYDLEKYI